MPQMTNVQTLRGKLLQMRESRDYWQNRARLAESELRIAARCVRAMLATRKAATKWLALFEADA
jgi:hypothetical protein